MGNKVIGKCKSCDQYYYWECLTNKDYQNFCSTACENDFKEEQKQEQDEILSAGLCDGCKHLEIQGTGGDNINEPNYPEPICTKRNFAVEPLPYNEQIKECKFFELNK